MNVIKSNYNLLDEQWIPVLYHHGTTARVGIRVILADAHKIRQIAAVNPMDRAAILRFLLALLYWCRGNPPENAHETLNDSFPPDWFSKLDDNTGCFDLLGDGKRFYQYKKGKLDKSANYLIHEIPTGNNFWHFRHATDKEDGLCLACCAMGLLRLPMFTTSGGSGLSPGINGKPPIYVIPSGQSLAETLRLSWQSVLEIGIPAWEKPDMKLPENCNISILTGLTWLPRCVWFDNPKGKIAACISCGRIGPLIHKCEFAGLGSQQHKSLIWCDPHVIYDVNSKDEDALCANDTLSTANALAAQWAIITLGILNRKNNNVRTLWVIGFATVQNDKYLEAKEFTIHLPGLQLLRAAIGKIALWQEKSQSNKLVGRMKPKTKDSHRKHVELSSMISSIRPHIETIISTKMDELLTSATAAWQEAANLYKPMMDAISKSLSPGFTTESVRRRLLIASTIPDFKINTDKKQSQKKGAPK